MKETILSWVVTFIVLFMMGSCSYVIYKDEKNYEDNKPTYPVIPKEFQDCKLGTIQISRYDSIKVMRCPNSTTTLKYSVGKYPQETVTKDGN